MNRRLLFILSLILISGSAIILAQSGTQCLPGGSPGTGLCNPAPAASLPGLVDVVIVIFTGFSITAIAFVAYSGLQMIISQGNEESLKKAKGNFKYAVLGWIVVILAYEVVSLAFNFFGAARQIPQNELNNPTQIFNPVGTDFLGLLNNMFQGFAAAVGILAVAMLIFSGVRYITAAGNEEQAKQAKTGITWAIAGIVVSLLAYVIIKAASVFFGVS